jgi:hypothetical protein
VLLTVDEFKTVESDVLKRREDLKKPGYGLPGTGRRWWRS